MGNTKEGALKIVAKLRGMSVEQYRLKIVDLKWCYKCRAWQPRTNFCIERGRHDGLRPKCRNCVRVKIRKSTKGRLSPFKGKHHKEEAKRLISLSHKNRKPRSGWHHSEETKQKIREHHIKNMPKGKDSPNYKHGLYQRNLNARRMPEYKQWRENVFRRDNYTCQKCGDKRGGNLRAHHIKPFATHPELRFVLSNGITECHKCHELEHYKPDSIRNQRKIKRGEALWK